MPATPDAVSGDRRQAALLDGAQDERAATLDQLPFLQVLAKAQRAAPARTVAGPARQGLGFSCVRLLHSRSPTARPFQRRGRFHCIWSGHGILVDPARRHRIASCSASSSKTARTGRVHRSPTPLRRRAGFLRPCRQVPEDLLETTAHAGLGLGRWVARATAIAGGAVGSETAAVVESAIAHQGALR